MSVAADQLSVTFPSPPVAVRVPGALGGVESGELIEVFMSDWISSTPRARLYTRTSSIRPLNHSPQMALPPIFNGDEEVRIVPATADDETWVPLT